MPGVNVQYFDVIWRVCPG